MRMPKITQAVLDYAVAIYDVGNEEKRVPSFRNVSQYTGKCLSNTHRMVSKLRKLGLVKEDDLVLTRLGHKAVKAVKDGTISEFLTNFKSSKQR